MSNPAVQTLAYDKIGNWEVTLEDNVGESIHLHLNEIRLDMSIDGFKELSANIPDIVDQIVGVDGFHTIDYDPAFLYTIMPTLLELEKVEICKVRLSDIKIKCGKSIHGIKYKPLSQSKDYLALKGQKYQSKVVSEYNHIGQSDDDRLNVIFNSIKENGYPFQGKRIVFFNRSNAIRDGQHRAACLFYEKGDIEIEAIRLHFANEKYDYEYNNKYAYRSFFTASWQIRKIKQIYMKFRKFKKKQTIKQIKRKNRKNCMIYQKVLESAKGI